MKAHARCLLPHLVLLPSPFFLPFDSRQLSTVRAYEAKLPGLSKRPTCHLLVRTPHVKLPNGSVRLVEPDFAGRLSGFTLLFEALVLMLAQQMPFAAVARIVGESAHRVLAVCERYVSIALGLADFSEMTTLAVDETSRARGHDYVTLAADAQARRVLFVTEGRGAKTIKALAADLEDHGCPPGQITCVSIDMSPAFIKGVTKDLPNARITFDKFHVKTVSGIGEVLALTLATRANSTRICQPCS